MYDMAFNHNLGMRSCGHLGHVLLYATHCQHRGESAAQFIWFKYGVMMSTVVW